MNVKRTSVWHRCLFEDPFFMDLDSSVKWECFHDTGFTFAAKMSSQLPGQNVINSKTLLSVSLHPVTSSWKKSPYPVSRLIHLKVSPKLIKSGVLKRKNQDTCLNQNRRIFLH